MVQHQDLPSAELEVLRVLWDHGASTVRQVLDRLHAQGREIAYTTVLTFLTRLEQKGFVRSDKSGVAYVYSPTVTRRSVSKSRLRTLLEELYDGAAAPLVLQLMKEEQFTPDEIQQFQDLVQSIEQKDSPRKHSKSHKGKRRGKS